MTYQEILEGITRHRMNPVEGNAPFPELARKLNEIEWALQAMCEKLRDTEDEG